MKKSLLFALLFLLSKNSPAIVGTATQIVDYEPVSFEKVVDKKAKTSLFRHQKAEPEPNRADPFWRLSQWSLGLSLVGIPLLFLGIGLLALLIAISIGIACLSVRRGNLRAARFGVFFSATILLLILIIALVAILEGDG